MQSEQGVPPIDSTFTGDIANPGHSQSKSVEESSLALQILFSRYANKWKQSTPAEDKQPKVARKSVDVLAGLIDGGEPDRVSDEEMDA
eukprot:9732993-Karenia_brevis.AAC.1